MQAIEYTKQQNAAPAVITIAIHFALLYVIAVGLHVVPSPIKADPFEYLNLPATPAAPDVEVEKTKQPQNDSIDLPRIISIQPPTIPVAEDFPSLPAIVSNHPIAEVAPIDTGIVVETTTIARIKYNPEPTYPLVSRAREEEGTVFVKVMISPYGAVTDVQLEKSSGFPRLDEAAVKAVRGWKFLPAKRGSHPVATWATVPVKFVLN